MPTTNLTVTSSSKNGLELTCWVYVTGPLYIYELIIEGVPGLLATTGTVKPGTAAHPVLRTIYVPDTDPVLQNQGSFTLSVTYDVNYKVIAPLVASLLANPPVFFNPAALAGLTDNDKATFVSEVLQAAAAPVNPPGPLMSDAASATALSPEAAAKKPHTHQPKEHGHP